VITINIFQRDVIGIKESVLQYGGVHKRCKGCESWGYWDLMSDDRITGTCWRYNKMRFLEDKCILNVI